MLLLYKPLMNGWLRVSAQ